MLDDEIALTGSWLLFAVGFLGAIAGATVTTNDKRSSRPGFFGWLIFVVGLLVAWSMATYMNLLPQGGSWWFLLIGFVVTTAAAAVLKPGIRNDLLRFAAWFVLGIGVLLILYVMPAIKVDFIAWMSSF